MNNWKNPLEHHSFRELVAKTEMVAVFSGNTVRRTEFVYKMMDYLKYKIVKRSWVVLDLIERTSRLEKLGRENGLLKIDGTYLCTSCLTSEYVKSDKRLNGGSPTCCRCNKTYKGWE